MDERTFKTADARSSADVLEFYSKYAASWDDRFAARRSTTAFHRARLQSFLRLANLRKTDVIIEIGAGTGPYLDALSPLVGKIICIDGSPKMLDVLSSKHRSLENVQILQMDLEKPIEGSIPQGDVLYCFGLIEHIIDLRTFLQNCRRLLKDNGNFIIVTPNGRSPWYGLIRRLCRAGKHCSSDRYFRKEELDRLLEPCGFRSSLFVYWGYFPAGVNDAVYLALDRVGRALEKTRLRRYAGGLTASYIVSASERC